MSSGTLARYPDLPVRFLIDWEGPADREDTTHGCEPDVGGIGSIEGMSACDDEAFWSQREALTFIEQIKVPYQRLQSEKDHAQPDNSHAIDMINAAISGGVPFVRLNEYPPGQTYDQNDPPEMMPEDLEKRLEIMIIRFAYELFSLPYAISYPETASIRVAIF